MSTSGRPSRFICIASKITSDAAITQAQTAPGAAFAAARYDSRGAAVFEAVVLSYLIGLIAAARAAQPGDTPLLLSRIDIQQLGDRVNGIRSATVHWLCLRLPLPVSPQSVIRAAAGAAVGTWQQHLRLFDAGILDHLQENGRRSPVSPKE